jgi:hypothetical protein
MIRLKGHLLGAVDFPVTLEARRSPLLLLLLLLVLLGVITPNGGGGGGTGGLMPLCAPWAWELASSAPPVVL